MRTRIRSGLLCGGLLLRLKFCVERTCSRLFGLTLGGDPFQFALVRRDDLAAPGDRRFATLADRGIELRRQRPPSQRVRRQRRRVQSVMRPRRMLLERGANRFGIAVGLREAALPGNDRVEPLFDQFVRRLVPATQAREQFVPHGRILDRRCRGLAQARGLAFQRELHELGRLHGTRFDGAQQLLLFFRIDRGRRGGNRRRGLDGDRFRRRRRVVSEQAGQQFHCAK